MTAVPSIVQVKAREVTSKAVPETRVSITCVSTCSYTFELPAQLSVLLTNVVVVAVGIVLLVGTEEVNAVKVIVVEVKLGAVVYTSIKNESVDISV